MVTDVLRAGRLEGSRFTTSLNCIAVEATTSTTSPPTAAPVMLKGIAHRALRINVSGKIFCRNSDRVPICKKINPKGRRDSLPFISWLRVKDQI